MKACFWKGHIPVYFKVIYQDGNAGGFLNDDYFQQSVI